MYVCVARPEFVDIWYRLFSAFCHFYDTFLSLILSSERHDGGQRRAIIVSKCRKQIVRQMTIVIYGRPAGMPQAPLLVVSVVLSYRMMTSSNGNIFRVTGHLCGEFTGPRWIPLTKASDAELWCFLWSVPEQTVSKQSRGWWPETPSSSLRRQCNVDWFMVYFNQSEFDIRETQHSAHLKQHYLRNMKIWN